VACMERDVFMVEELFGLGSGCHPRLLDHIDRA
jgi:hypothetical protein